MENKMLIVDNMLLKVLGVIAKPFDIIWILEIMRDFAYKQMYNTEEISDKLKENRMLFELGEISKKTYEEAERILKNKLEEAEKVSEHITQSKDVALL